MRQIKVACQTNGTWVDGRMWSNGYKLAPSTSHAVLTTAPLHCTAPQKLASLSYPKYHFSVVHRFRAMGQNKLKYPNDIW